MVKSPYPDFNAFKIRHKYMGFHHSLADFRTEFEITDNGALFVPFRSSLPIYAPFPILMYTMGRWRAVDVTIISFTVDEGTSSRLVRLLLPRTTVPAMAIVDLIAPFPSLSSRLRLIILKWIGIPRSLMIFKALTRASDVDLELIFSSGIWLGTAAAYLSSTLSSLLPAHLLWDPQVPPPPISLHSGPPTLLFHIMNDSLTHSTHSEVWLILPLGRTWWIFSIAWLVARMFAPFEFRNCTIFIKPLVHGLWI